MLNIYREGDQIIIEDGQERIEKPYSSELIEQLTGEITYNEFKGWMINGKELNEILA
jgi:hypothetical protein